MTPDMPCRSCRELLMEYAANVLPERDRRAVAAHLATCAGCRSELAGWQAIGAAVRADEQEIPLDTFTVASWDAIRDRLPSRPLLSINAIAERSDMNDEVSPAPASRRARLTPSHPSRWRPYVAVAAFLLVVTLAVAVFAVIGAGGGAHKQRVGVSPTAAAPSTCSTSQLKAEAPPYSSIRSISMVSPTDGWAVGFVWNWQSPTPPATLIMRFHNCTWEPFGQSIPSAWLYSVSMGSDGDGWAVGSTVNYISNPVSNAPNTTALYEPQSKQLLVLRLANGQWQRAAMPESDGAVIGATVRMTSTSDGWMLVNGGKSHTDPFAIAEADTVLHYTNGAWTAVPTPFKTPGTYFWDVASVTAGECWIAGYDPNTGASLVAHYQNGQWQTWNPVPSGDNYGGLTSIGVTSSHDVWAATPYELFHFDGSTWTQVQLPTAPRQTSSGAFPELVMRSASDGWMVAPSATIVNNKVAGPLALHYDGESWQWVTIPAPDMNGVLTMRYISNTQAWAAGGSFTMTSAGHVPQARFLFLDNGSWTEIPD